jgi:hypothetical protein
MRYSIPCCHQVKLPWLDNLSGPDAVSVITDPFEQPGDSLKSGVRVSRNYHSLNLFGWSEMI